jgi:hypothetical protein
MTLQSHSSHSSLITPSHLSYSSLAQAERQSKSGAGRQAGRQAGNRNELHHHQRCSRDRAHLHFPNRQVDSASQNSEHSRSQDEDCMEMRMAACPASISYFIHDIVPYCTRRFYSQIEVLYEKASVSAGKRMRNARVRESFQDNKNVRTLVPFVNHTRLI